MKAFFQQLKSSPVIPGNNITQARYLFSSPEKGPDGKADPRSQKQTGIGIERAKILSLKEKEMGSCPLAIIKRPIITIFLILSLSLPALAQKGEGGTESNLSMGFGARALGLGQAFTALSDDPSAVFWNPAGLEYVYQQSFSFFHSTLFEGASYDFLGYAFPTLDLGTFGVGVGRIGIGDITQRGLLGEELGGKFSWDEYQAFLSYGKRLPWNITGGLSMRIVRRAWNGLAEEGNLIDYGFGLDLGLMYKPELFSNVLLRDWSLGVNVQNLFTPQVKEGIDVEEFPLTIRFGMLRKLYFFGAGNPLNLLIDFDYSEKRDTRLHFGTEYRFRDLGALRVGYNGSVPTFGAGIQYSIFQLDYAFGQTAYSDVFSAMHQLSVSLNFGMNRDELFEIAEAKRKAGEERIIADMREADRQRLVAQHLKNGDTFFAEKKYLDAIVEYQQVLGQEAFNEQAQVMLDSSDSMLKRQLAEQRAFAVQEAIDKERAESDRVFITDHFEKGRLFLDKNQFTEALIEFNLAQERAPDDPMILDAISTTRRRLKEEIGRLVSQGRQQFQAGNYSEAMRLLSDARVFGGDNAQIQSEIETLIRRVKIQDNIQKGLSLFEIGEYDRALTMFEDVLRLNPDEELARQYLEKTKIESQSKQEEMDPETERRYLEGMDKFVKGKYQEAITIWEEIITKHPYNKKVVKAIKGARERLNRSK